MGDAAAVEVLDPLEDVLHQPGRRSRAPVGGVRWGGGEGAGPEGTYDYPIEVPGSSVASRRSESPVVAHRRPWSAYSRPGEEGALRCVGGGLRKWNIKIENAHPVSE